MGLITNALLAIKIKSGRQRQKAHQKLTTARHRRHRACTTSINECVQQQQQQWPSHAEESSKHAGQDQEVNLFEFVVDHTPSLLSNERSRQVDSAGEMDTAAASRHERRHQARLSHYQQTSVKHNDSKHHMCHKYLGPSSASISQEHRNQRRSHKHPKHARKTSILQQMFLITFCCLMLTTATLSAYEHHHHEHHHKKHYEAPIVKVIHKTVHIPKAIPVPKFIPVPKIIPVPKTVAVPHPVHISVKVPIYKTVKKVIPVPKPVHVHKPVPVPKPYAVAVPVPVFKHHPYPVYKHVPVHKPYGVPMPYKVHKYVPVGIAKVVHVPKPYPVPYKVPVYKEVIVKKPVEVPVPVYIKKKPVYHPPVYKHVHKKHHEHHHGHGHYAAATNDQFMAVQPGTASANIQQQGGEGEGGGGGSLSPAASHQQTLMMAEQPNGQHQQQGHYSQYMQANHQAMSNRDNWPAAMNDNSNGDKLRGMTAVAHQQVVADQQQQQQQQQMMVAASNMDQSSPTSQADLITQGSSPPGSSAATRPSQASHARHQPQSVPTNGPDDATNGLQAGGEFSTTNQQIMSSAQGDKHQFHNHQMEPAKSAKLSRGPGSLEMIDQQQYISQGRAQSIANGPFHYQTASSMIGVGNSNKSPSASGIQSIFSPRHLMMAQASNLSPSTLVQAPMQFNTAGGISNIENTNSNLLDQSTSSVSDTQQVFAVQQQPRNAILNQLTKLWSIVGKQRSLLPSITSPFGSKQATLNQRQMQLLMNNQIAASGLDNQQQQQPQMIHNDSINPNALTIVK